MSSPTATCSPFTQAVIGAMRKLYPEKLADSSFDNTGLLLEAPYRQNNGLKPSVLLTIDLTKAVADEAIRRKDSVIISYHPIIFRPLKSLTLANTQQNTLLRLAQEGISVYSPHTAVDAAPGGLNDWLADVVSGTEAGSTGTAYVTLAPHARRIINPVKDIGSLPATFSIAGYGRIVTFEDPQQLGTIIERITYGLGRLDGVSVAVPQSTPVGEKSQVEILTVGICAGSGGSMLNGLDVDLLFTGELSHHEALSAIENGKCVITAFHSNTERAFLKQRMQGQLAKAVRATFSTTDLGEFDVAVSKMDRDPFEIVRDPEDW